MKKILILLSIATAMPLALNAVSKSDVIAGLSSAIDNLNMNALHSRVSVAEQQKVVTQWDTAVGKAKQFVLDNCKDLLRKEDPDLMNFLKRVENLNIDFTNTIKTIRGSLPNAPISKLLGISTDAGKLKDQINVKSFTLPGKKEAQDVLSSVAFKISNSAKYLYDDLVQKK